MKRLLTIAFFTCATTFAFAQYNHVQYGTNGNKLEEGQYNTDPGLTANDTKEVIAQKMATVHKIGTWKYWFENGQVTAEEHYDANGNRTGVWKTWYNNGTLESEINYTSGSAVYYHANGSKAEEGTINTTTNMRTGTWQGWYENGNVNYTGVYNAAGQKNGAWKYYDNTGAFLQTQNFQNDQLMN